MVQLKVRWAGEIVNLVFPTSDNIYKQFYVKKVVPWSKMKDPVNYLEKLNARQREWGRIFGDVAGRIMKREDLTVKQRRQLISEELRRIAEEKGFTKTRQKKAKATA